MSDKIGLSKSRYCRGVQCSKMLWMDKNKPELAEDTASEQVLANGNKVGDLAREYFGEYSLVECSADKAAMCKQTAELMNSGVENIAEASFVYDGLYCAVDILRKNGDAFKATKSKRKQRAFSMWQDTHIMKMLFRMFCNSFLIQMKVMDLKNYG